MEPRPTIFIFDEVVGAASGSLTEIFKILSIERNSRPDFDPEQTEEIRTSIEILKAHCLVADDKTSKRTLTWIAEQNPEAIIIGKKKYVTPTTV